jgi:hypothetical protein
MTGALQSGASSRDWGPNAIRIQAQVVATGAPLPLRSKKTNGSPSAVTPGRYDLTTHIGSEQRCTAVTTGYNRTR